MVLLPRFPRSSAAKADPGQPRWLSIAEDDNLDNLFVLAADDLAHRPGDVAANPSPALRRGVNCICLNRTCLPRLSKTQFSKTQQPSRGRRSAATRFPPQRNHHSGKPPGRYMRKAVTLTGLKPDTDQGDAIQECAGRARLCGFGGAGQPSRWCGPRFGGDGRGCTREQPGPETGRLLRWRRLRRLRPGYPCHGDEKCGGED